MLYWRMQLVWSAPSQMLPPNRRDSKTRLRMIFWLGLPSEQRQALGQEPAALELVAQQFNSITPENLLKWQEVHPQPNQFNFDPADRFVKFGQQNNMFIVGHNSRVA